MDRLGLRKWEAIGLLECLWHFTAKFTPEGNIGKFSDDTTSRSPDWDRTSPEDLISALVDVGWIDICGTHRLVVHDRSEHCDRALRENLKRSGRGFADVYLRYRLFALKNDGPDRATEEIFDSKQWASSFRRICTRTPSKEPFNPWAMPRPPVGKDV